ncbi:hypothetical protein ACFXOM_34235 [Streptomyces sp. NPDC059169]|uniref:hypothetical protein n=1 Tax=unclassified Streptomyces TaxID=2593676 RepID=UPI0036B87F99
MTPSATGSTVAVPPATGRSTVLPSAVPAAALLQPVTPMVVAVRAMATARVSPGRRALFQRSIVMGEWIVVTHKRVLRDVRAGAGRRGPALVRRPSVGYEIIGTPLAALTA